MRPAQNGSSDEWIASGRSDPSRGRFRSTICIGLRMEVKGGCGDSDGVKKQKMKSVVIEGTEF